MKTHRDSTKTISSGIGCIFSSLGFKFSLFKERKGSNVILKKSDPKRNYQRSPCKSLKWIWSDSQVTGQTGISNRYLYHKTWILLNELLNYLHLRSLLRTDAICSLYMRLNNLDFKDTLKKHVEAVFSPPS